MTKGAWHTHFKRAKKISRTDRDGTVFHSKSEMMRWHTLKLWQLAGHIRNLKRQVKFPLEGHGVKILTEKGQVANYTADFVYETKGDLMQLPPRADMAVHFEKNGYRPWVETIEDHKGYHNREGKFRISVFEALYDCKVKINKG